MRLFRRRPAVPFTRVFFATDLHGSTSAFKKFLSAARVYEADVLVMGGDLSGKSLLPIVDHGDGTYDVALHGEARRVRAGEELGRVRDAAETQGQYHAVVTPEEYAELQARPRVREELFLRLVRERLASWRALADERLVPLGVRCYVTGGNDDEPETIAGLADADDGGALVLVEGRRVQLDEHHTMISCGWSNPTPWNTPREVSEEVLAGKLERCVAGIEDLRQCVFNIHPPPYDSTLDLCPKLDASTDPPSPVFHGGQVVTAPAGSTAVRELIERCQPLLGLHGHIHESRAVADIGRTVLINPGSEYGEGILRGCLVNLTEDRVLSYQMTSG